jgi:hypothetical protein
MPDRKQFLGDMTPDPELTKLLAKAAEKPVSDDEIREQRISFAYGNAPADATGITKDSVRYASEHLRLRS